MGNRIGKYLTANAESTKVVLQHKKLVKRDFRTLGRFMKRNEYCEELDVSYNSIGDKHVQYLAAALVHNKHLKRLLLHHCSIGDAGVVALCEALVKNRGIVELDLSHNCIRDVGMEAIGKLLRENKHLERVSLKFNYCGDHGGLTLAAGLEDNTSLKALDLENNHLGSSASHALADALMRNSTLLELVLSSNHIGDTGARAIASMLMSNVTLESLLLGGNNFGERLKMEIADTLKARRSAQSAMQSEQRRDGGRLDEIAKRKMLEMIRGTLAAHTKSAASGIVNAADVINQTLKRHDSVPDCISDMATLVPPPPPPAAASIATPTPSDDSISPQQLVCTPISVTAPESPASTMSQLVSVTPYTAAASPDLSDHDCTTDQQQPPPDKFVFTPRSLGDELMTPRPISPASNASHASHTSLQFEYAVATVTEVFNSPSSEPRIKVHEVDELPSPDIRQIVTATLQSSCYADSDTESCESPCVGSDMLTVAGAGSVRGMARGGMGHSRPRSLWFVSASEAFCDDDDNVFDHTDTLQVPCRLPGRDSAFSSSGLTLPLGDAMLTDHMEAMEQAKPAWTIVKSEDDMSISSQQSSNSGNGNAWKVPQIMAPKVHSLPSSRKLECNSDGEDYDKASYLPREMVLAAPKRENSLFYASKVIS
eukprot:TRINITY_DN11258_c0_g1_i1.p1 TRINITY_DN11258_c0_g1~~TRINITY_DN11258_c0_g1_i1.p1  ORF type:complete len:654 (-),score=150.64 TRINITY_DN11258_c0_g1_i1:66-2027(-)